MSIGTSHGRGSISPEEAEALSLLTTILWVLQMGLTHVIFEVDCKQLFNSIHSNHIDKFEFGCIANSYKHHLNLISNSSLSLVS